MLRLSKKFKVLTAAALAVTALGFASTSKVEAASFNYSYGNPFDAAAQTYIHSTSNISLYAEGPVRLWKPNFGGTTFGNTTPGVITYKFDFGSDVVDSANLFTHNPTFHWSYSRGHNRLFGSKDGTNWELLLDTPPPAFGSANGGTYNGALPATLLGGTELWVRVDLYSYGPSAPGGGVLTNTAQHSRYDVNSAPGTIRFSLDVEFENAAAVPLPAGLPLLAAALGVFGLAGWRRRRSA